MFDTPLAPPAIDYESIDGLVAKARHERSKVLTEMVRSLFRKPSEHSTMADGCTA